MTMSPPVRRAPRAPRARVVPPHIVSVLRDTVNLTKAQVDILTTKGELSNADALKLSGLVRTLREAWELETAVENALADDLGRASDEDLVRMTEAP